MCIRDRLDTLIEQSVALIGKPAALMNKEEKVTAIQFLNDAGAVSYTHLDVYKRQEFVKIGSAVPRPEALTVATLVAHIIHVDDLMLLHARNNQRDIGSVGAYLNTCLLYTTCA